MTALEALRSRRYSRSESRVSEGWANALWDYTGDPDYKDTSGADQNGVLSANEEGFASVVNITSGWFSEDSVAEINGPFDSTNDAADADTISSLAEMTKALTVDVRIRPYNNYFSLMASLNTSNQSSRVRLGPS